MAERFNGPFKTVITAFAPPQQEMDPETIYLLTMERDRSVDPSKIQASIYLCPCRCNQLVFMKLLPLSNKGWSFEQHADGAVSFSPSVWGKVEDGFCGAHFFIRAGMVDWCS